MWGTHYWVTETPSRTPPCSSATGVPGGNATRPRAANVCLGSGHSFQSEETTWEQRGLLPVEAATAMISHREGRSDVLLGKTSSGRFLGPLEIHQGKCLAKLHGRSFQTSVFF